MDSVFAKNQHLDAAIAFAVKVFEGPVALGLCERVFSICRCGVSVFGSFEGFGARGAAVGTVFLAFLRLGFTAFGGPLAHLALFREEFVNRRRWLSERDFADWLALCQFLPGPTSSQLGMLIGQARAGFAGSIAAWIGFTLPGALLLSFLASALVHGWASGGAAAPLSSGVVRGLQLAVVAVVAQAVWGMARQHAWGGWPGFVALLSAGVALSLPLPWAAWVVLGLGAAVGLGTMRRSRREESLRSPPGASAGWLALIFLLVFLVALPLSAAAFPAPLMTLADAVFRAGALVFGGGHVVLPMLEAEVVARGWMPSELFLAGYGLAQAIPGPLFSFAAFVGAAAHGGSLGALGAFVALLAIFTPGFLLVQAAYPFWERLRHHSRARAALAGVNAAVVGLLAAALVDPVWTHAVRDPKDILAVALAVFALVVGRFPPWAVVPLCGLAGGLFLQHA
jgi:chromate transporter